MNESKKLFYVWFLGARECRGLRGEEYVRPIVRYLKKKEEECEPPKVTLQIWPKGIKLVADSLRHLVPSHAVTYVSQGQPPEDDIVSVILLLYNPITKCPVHLHAYRCDSVETADLLRQQLQGLIDLPENQKKIRDLEDRLQSQGLYPGAREKSDSRLLKSCDTGIGGSSADLLATCNQSESDGEADRRSDHSAANERGRPSLNVNRNKVTGQSFTRSDQDRIARLYDSLAAELRDKLSGVLTGKAAPLLLPPRDYDTQQLRKTPQTAVTSQSNTRTSTNHVQVRTLQRNMQDNGSSSGLSSGIGSDLDDPNPVLNERSKNGGRDWAMLRSVSCQENQTQRRVNQQTSRQRYSYHEPISNNNNINNDIRLQRDHQITLQRQSSDRRDLHRDNRRSMTDLRKQQHQAEDDQVAGRFADAYTLRRREESFSSRDVIGRKNDMSPTSRDADFRDEFSQRRKSDYPEGRSRVKDALSKFESSPGVAGKVALAGGHADKKVTSASARSRSFHDEQPSWMGAATKFRRVPYQELDQRERFPGLDRDTARLDHHVGTAPLGGASSPSSRHLQRHKSTEFVSSMATGYGGASGNRSDSVPFFVEPVGKNHFRAVRQSLTIEHIHQNRR